MAVFCSVSSGCFHGQEHQVGRGEWRACGVEKSAGDTSLANGTANGMQAE